MKDIKKKERKKERKKKGQFSEGTDSIIEHNYVIA